MATVALLAAVGLAGIGVVTPLPTFVLAGAFASANRTPAPPNTAAGPSDLTLTILHDNDLHGHLLPFAYTETGRSHDEMPSVGGAARRATLIRHLRAEAKNPVFLVDSGDTFTRGPFTNRWEGIADTEAMNAVGYDLAAIGNNEFKAKDATEMRDAAGSQAALLRIIKRSRFPWICANVTDEKGALLEGVQPFVVRKFGPLRVGFLGLVTGRVGGYPQAKGLRVADAVAAAKQYIPLARAQCDVLIAVTHIGVDDDKKLAAQTTGIDAIVGGDSHTFLYRPVEVKNADGSQTVPIVQDGEFGVDLGKFDLRFTRESADGAWHLTSWHDELLPVGPNLKEAPDVAGVIAPYYAPLAEVVGKLPADQIGKTPEERNRLSTQVWTDALRRQTGADLAVNPVGGGFFDVFRSPTIRRYDVYAAEPFKNTAVVATMTGAQVKSLLAARTDNVVSGDVTALDDGRTYRVALVDFVAATFYRLPSSSLAPTGKDIRELLIEDLRGRQG